MASLHSPNEDPLPDVVPAVGCRCRSRDHERLLLWRGASYVTGNVLIVDGGVSSQSHRTRSLAEIGRPGGCEMPVDRAARDKGQWWSWGSLGNVTGQTVRSAVRL